MLLHNAFVKAFVVVVAMCFASSTAAAALPVNRRLGTPKSSNKTKSRANAAPTAKKYSGRSNLTVAALVGDDRYPGYAYPLKKCQGDCDSDDDCELGLFCQQRFSNESVAGCTGLRTAAMYEVDICYDPDDRLVFNMTFAANATLVRVGNNLEPAAAFPLQKVRFIPA
jgi:hypothetical protein